MKKNLTLLFVLALGVLPGRGATLVPVASPGWRVLKGTAEASVPIENWRKTGFVDSSFSAAPAPFWYGDVLPGGTQLSDMANGYSSFYLRHRFVVTNLTEIAALKLGAQVDDGFIAWINGAEVARVNGPSSPQHDGLATAAAVEPVVFSTYRLPTQNYLVLGTNVLCVQVFNVALGDSDIGFDCSLTSQLTETNPPVVLSQSPAPGTTVGKLDHLNITFSEPVDGVEASDLLIDTFPATAVNGAGAAYTFTFPQPEYGPVTITWAPFHGIADLSVPPNPFNAEGPGATWAYSLKDLEAPTLDKVLPESGTTVLSLLEIEVFFSEEMKGVDASDLLINGVAAKSIRFGGLSDVVFGFELTTTGVVNVAFAPGHGITDLAGNPFPGGSWTYTVDPNFIPPSVVINELMALNTKIIRDEDGDYSDWIELFNNGIHGVDLSQWTLTDDPANLRKWHFPVMTMLPGDYLLVWASGKNRTNAVNKLHTNFKLPTGGSFLALVDGRTNIASGFVPTYPPQSADISYGRDTTDQNLLGFFSTPTPRTVNKASGASVVPPVEFSRAEYFIY